MIDRPIRWVDNRDGPAIKRLIASIFDEYPGCTFVAEEYPELDAPMSSIAAKNGAFFVVDCDDTDEGEKAIGATMVAQPTSDDRVFELKMIYCAETLRGKGVARRMLRHMVSWCMAHGAESLRLWTDTRFLRGHRFYEKHGFSRLPGIRYLGDASQSWEFPYAIRLFGEEREVIRNSVATPAHH